MLAWITGSILFLVLLIYILIQVPAVQNFARKKAVAYLQDKLQTKVMVNKFSLAFPKSIVLEGIYFEDRQKDTLLAGGKIQVDIALLKLLKSQVEINAIYLKDVTAKISRTGNDSSFNYQYIIDAFAPKNAPADTKAGMQIKVDKIELENIAGSFKDVQTGMDFYGRIGLLKTAFKKFDADKMIFDLPDIVLENASGYLYQNKPLLSAEPMAAIEAQSNEPFNLQLGLKNISIKNILFDYKNVASVMNAHFKWGEVSAVIKSIDLAALKAEAEKLTLHNTSSTILLGKSEQTKIVKKEINKEVKAQANNPWNLRINTIDAVNNQLLFDDDNKPRLSSGMDYGHLKIDSFTLKAGNFIITPTAYTGNISNASFKEKSGFKLKTLQTDFAYSDTGASLKSLYVQTDKTLIRDNITVQYPSLEAVTNNMALLYLDANFVQSDLAAKDILIFAPQLKTNLKGNENAVAHINARVRGYINNLNLPLVQISGIGNTVISMSGNIKGLPDPNRAVYDLNIGNFQTDKSTLLSFLPPGTVPPTVRLPDVFKMSGTFKGSATSFTTNLLLQTNKGNVSLNGFINSTAQTYNVKGSLQQADMGYILKQDTMLGKVTMTFAAKGKGFTPARMNTNASAHVQAAFIKGYNYQNINAVAAIHNGFTTLDAGMADKSLAFNMKGEALIDDKFATNIKMRLMLDSILLLPLGFANTDVRIHGNILADIPSADMNAPQGNIQIGELVVVNDGKRYNADSIYITANTTDTGKIITLQSQVATASLKGKYNLASIGNSAMQVINKYYNIGINKMAVGRDAWQLDAWQLDAQIIPDSLLFVFAPMLNGTDTIHVKATFDGSTEKINMLVNAPRVQLGQQVLDSLTLSAGNAANELVYSASVNRAGTKAFRLQKTNLDGFIANNQVYAKLNIKDKNGKDKYQLATTLVQENNNGLRASLSDTLLLDYNNWAVDKSNYISYSPAGIIIHHFDINNSGQSLSINSAQENTAAPIALSVNNFRIKTLTNLAEQDSLLMDGMLQGNVLVKNALTNPVFTADIKLDSLTYNADTIGNIAVKIDNETANVFNTAVAITGNSNDVKLFGKYFTGEGKMDMRADIANFNLASIKPFTFGNLTQADGSLKGAVDIKGTTANPDVDGTLRFENASFTPKLSGEKLHLSSETIAVHSHDITFNQFTLRDSAGNKAIINGNIFTQDYKTYRFDLGLNAKNFRALTAPPKQHKLYYGDMNIDAAIKLKGTLTAPSINADLKINKSTDITFVLPTVNPEIEQREGVVEFADVYGTSTDSIFKAALDTLTRFPELAGMDFTSTLQSDTSAQINLVVDERSGDVLKIRGKADLAAGFDKSGKISLTGNYELQNGSYQLNLSLLKRQFNIQPGSVITWTGDPMSANVDITATYVANTQPVNLLQSELATLSATDAGKYNSKVPFNVLLKMKGELLKPQISFDIELPEDQQSKWADVVTKLEQVRRDDAELNKQVFALLLLGRFIQENPLENSAEGTSLATTAKTSVSRILTEQLNNLAGSLIKGVDLNFGINTEDDFSTGTRTSRTDLTVGVSKRLLNDRLRVNVGSNFGIEGPANSNQSASNIAGDVAVDYLLSKDGRYALRAYRRNRYEGVVEGQVIESGVSFIFSFDFNELNQIFNRKTEAEKLLQQAESEKKKTDQQKEKTSNTAAGNSAAGNGK